MSENNTLKNTIRMQKFQFELLQYIYIYIFIYWLDSKHMSSYMVPHQRRKCFICLKKSLPYSNKLDICESLQHLKAWRFPFRHSELRRQSATPSKPSLRLSQRSRIGGPRQSWDDSLGYNGVILPGLPSNKLT